MNTLTHALQSTGLDLSQASISVQIDLGKRANRGVTSGISIPTIWHITLISNILLKTGSSELESCLLSRTAVISFPLNYSLLILLYIRIMKTPCLLAINQLGISGRLATGRTWIKLKKERNCEDNGFFLVNVPNSVLCHSSSCSRSTCWYMYKVIICCL